MEQNNMYMCTRRSRSFALRTALLVFSDGKFSSFSNLVQIGLGHQDH
jgi:hypothetical protein